MSQMLMAIFVAYSISGITSDKKILCDLKMAVILEKAKYKTQLQFDRRNEKLCKKKYFYCDDVIDDVTHRPQSRFSIILNEW